MSMNPPPTGHAVMADAFGNLTAKVLARLDARFSPASVNEVLAVSAPSWSAASGHSWLSSGAIYNSESPHLERFRRRFREGLKGRATRCTWIGDSKTYGTWRDAVPYYVQDWTGARVGMIYAAPQDNRWNLVTGYAIAAGTQQYLAPDASSLHTAILTTDRAHTGFTLYGAATAGGSVTVTVDGGAPQTWTVPAGNAWSGFTVDGLADATHVINVSTTAAVSLLGADMRYTTPGLAISNAARNASTAAGWNATGWNDLWTGALAPGAPDLIIAGIGTNDPTNTAALDTLYDKLVATGKPVVMTAPGGLEVGDTARAAMVRYLYSIANRLDLPLIDYRAVIGTAEQATVFGLKRDTLHENERGYVLEARVTVSSLA